MELPTLGEELSETELPDLTDGGDLDEEPSIGEMPLMEEEEPEAADTSLIDEEPSIGEMPVFDDLNDAASAVEEVQAEPVEEVEAEEVPTTEEATVEPDTDAVTLTCLLYTSRWV